MSRSHPNPVLGARERRHSAQSAPSSSEHTAAPPGGPLEGVCHSRVTEWVPIPGSAKALPASPVPRLGLWGVPATRAWLPPSPPALGFRAVDLIRNGGKKMRFLVAKSDVETAKKIRFRTPPS